MHTRLVASSWDPSRIEPHSYLASRLTDIVRDELQDFWAKQLFTLEEGEWKYATSGTTMQCWAVQMLILSARDTGVRTQVLYHQPEVVSFQTEWNRFRDEGRDKATKQKFVAGRVAMVQERTEVHLLRLHYSFILIVRTNAFFQLSRLLEDFSKSYYAAH